MVRLSTPPPGMPSAGSPADPPVPALHSLATRLAAGAKRMVSLGMALVAGLSLLVICGLLVQQAQSDLQYLGDHLALKLQRSLTDASAGLGELSRRTLVRNALVDPSGRGAYLGPTLREHRQNSPGLTALWLTDHRGELLAQSSADPDPSDQPHKPARTDLAAAETANEPTNEPGTEQAAVQQHALRLARQVLQSERPVQQLHRSAQRWWLLRGEPVVFTPTGTVEGALLGLVDLGQLIAPELATLDRRWQAEVAYQEAGQRTPVLAQGTVLAAGQFSQRWRLGQREEATPGFSLVLATPWHVALAPAAWVAAGYALVGWLLMRLVRQRTAVLAEEAVLPLRLLRDAAHQVAQQGLDSVSPVAEADLQRGGAEVHSLARSFQAMLERLFEAQTLLEAQVAHRTAELGQAKPRLDTILALSPDAFVSFDGQGAVVSVNPAFERLTGLPVAELIGLSGAEFEARVDALVLQRDPPGMAHWLADLEPDPAVHNSVLILRGPPQRVLVCSRRDCDAPDISRVVQLRDISRETEVDRMKSEFLSTAAHELRTPMASIRGFSDLLLMRKFDEARTRDILQTINRQSIWLTDMVNELLDLARIEARKGKDFELETCELRSLIESGVSALMVPGDARQVQLHLPEGPLPLRVDRAKFQHALGNVLSNAFKYSPQGGEITLTVLREDAGAGQAARVGIAVRDQGIGMKPEHAARAFERFFRADASGNIPGTGLGLALVKEIIELHGGQVALHSVWGQGTTVTLWLPALAQVDALPSALPDTDHNAPASTLSTAPTAGQPAQPESLA